MNRRQRRAQAASSSSSRVTSADDIPLAQPDRDHISKKAKTLYELAAERQASLMPSASNFDSLPSPENVVNVKIGPNGEIVREKDLGEDEAGHNTFSEDEAVPPILDTLFLATSLSALHFTLDVLTVHQYAQELLFKPIIKRAVFSALPTLCLLIHFSRGHLLPASMSAAASPRTRKIVAMLRQVCFVVLANVVGCYLIQLTNDKGYYAVMKKAPSVGTMWVWAVLELRLVGALAGVIGPAAYAWYWGYGIF